MMTNLERPPESRAGAALHSFAFLVEVGGREDSRKWHGIDQDMELEWKCVWMLLLGRCPRMVVWAREFERREGEGRMARLQGQMIRTMKELDQISEEGTAGNRGTHGSAQSSGCST